MQYNLNLFLVRKEQGTVLYCGLNNSSSVDFIMMKYVIAVITRFGLDLWENWSVEKFDEFRKIISVDMLWRIDLQIIVSGIG